ncbi:unnamed protein product [Miscanthus lutarioriparius]|uniref:Uncharacterized protein n=1 Tax=Miscanthus lutarioriparius TaxID=422564 RepID=A0A811QEK3_9POAL|nr:unnamed protein product [Miscanthus lutarioriparius]
MASYHHELKQPRVTQQIPTRSPRFTAYSYDSDQMSGNGMSGVFTPVIQGKDQQSSMNSMQNHNTGNSTTVPVTGLSFTGGAVLSGNSVNVPPPPQIIIS